MCTFEQKALDNDTRPKSGAKETGRIAHAKAVSKKTAT